MTGHFYKRNRNIDRSGVWVERDLRFAPFELANHLCNLLIEREFLFTVIRPLTQHERLDNTSQCLRRERRVGDYDRVFGFIVHHCR